MYIFISRNLLLSGRTDGNMSNCCFNLALREKPDSFHMILLFETLKLVRSVKIGPAVCLAHRETQRWKCDTKIRNDTTEDSVIVGSRWLLAGTCSSYGLVRKEDENETSDHEGNHVCSFNQKWQLVSGCVPSMQSPLCVNPLFLSGDEGKKVLFLEDHSQECVAYFCEWEDVGCPNVLFFLHLSSFLTIK